MKKYDEKEFNLRTGRRLHELRVAQGMSQTAVAEALGVSFQQVQKYERGVNMPSPWKLNRLAEILGVPLARLFEEAETKLPDAGQHRHRVMTLMRKLHRIEQENPRAFTALCDMARALSAEKD